MTAVEMRAYALTRTEAARMVAAHSARADAVAAHAAATHAAASAAHAAATAAIAITEAKARTMAAAAAAAGAAASSANKKAFSDLATLYGAHFHEAKNLSAQHAETANAAAMTAVKAHCESGGRQVRHCLTMPREFLSLSPLNLRCSLEFLLPEVV